MQNIYLIVHYKHTFVNSDFSAACGTLREIFADIYY